METHPTGLRLHLQLDLTRMGAFCDAGNAVDIGLEQGSPGVDLGGVGVGSRDVAGAVHHVEGSILVAYED